MLLQARWEQAARELEVSKERLAELEDQVEAAEGAEKRWQRVAEMQLQQQQVRIDQLEAERDGMEVERDKAMSQVSKASL